MDAALTSSLARVRLATFIRHLTRRQKFVAMLTFLLIIAIASKTYESSTYAFFSYSASQARAETANYAEPTFIYIPSLQIALPIDETTINHGVWEINDKGASHLASSLVPGQRGNTIIYAKNTADGFAPITSLIPGDTLIVSTKDGMTHQYAVNQTQIVSPTDSQLINNTEEEVLTLYTSYGFGDMKRFVVQAIPLDN